MKVFENDPDSPAAEPPAVETGEEPGKKPAAGEGQEPDQGSAEGEGADAPKRTYSPAYVKQLRKEAQDNREEKERLQQQLDAIKESEKTEAQKEREARESIEKERDELKLAQLRVTVGGEQGLPIEAIKFLTGQSREEIELHAEELGKLLKQGKPAIGFDGGARPKAPPVEKDPEQAHNDLLLRAIGRLPEGRAS